jgi:hypothetical protein
MGKGKSTPMTPKAASRIQSAGAKQTVSKTAKTGFAERAQSAGTKNVNPQKSGK